MSTQPTEAHLKLAHQVANLGSHFHGYDHARAAQLIADSEARAVEAALAEEKNLHAQTRTVVEELNTICTDLKNAGGPPFVRSEAIRLLREDQAQLRGMLAAERERVRVLEEAEKEANAKLALYRSKVFRVKSILSSIEDDGTEQHHSATPERKEGSG